MHLSSLDELSARLGGVAAPPEKALIALAVLDPAAAAAWLVDHESADATTLPRARLSTVVTAVAEAIVGEPTLVAPRDVHAIIARYGHLLAPTLVGELAGAARGGALDPALDEALRSALERAPANAGLLRPAAELAAAAGDYPRAHELLTRLGRAEPTASTMRFVHRARTRLPDSESLRTRVALVSSFTIDPLIPYLDLECRSIRLSPEIYVAPFNTWERETLGEGSGLQRFEPQIVFLSVAADDLLPELASAPAAALAEAGRGAVDRLLAAAARFVSWSSAILVVHGLHTAFRDPLGPAAGRDERSRSEVMAELNARLAEGLRGLPRAYCLDLADVLVRRRQGPGDNPKMRHLAGMRLTEQVLGDVAAAYVQFIAPVMGRTRKCVVLDLDNTLWGGIVGEDGPHGIQLGNTAPGSEYREFQEYLLSLTRRGMLLAINSKNNAADALEVIRGHDAMVLREDAFSAVRINWENKASNLRGIAEELSLGLDAFVFIDDSDKERALMRQALPQVLTPEMPRDPARYRETLEALPELQVLTITEADRTRTRQYAERRQREHLRVEAQTPAEYLASLGIVAEMSTATERTLPRVHQLFQRTNQFNLTGRRYELGALAARANDADWRIYTSSVGDRFGEHGLVAAALVRVTPESWIVDNLVMSCRVIGYGVEDALLARLAADARAASAACVLGEFIASPKNAPARDFYARLAFVRENGDSDGAERWQRDLADGGPSVPAWVTVKATDGA